MLDWLRTCEADVGDPEIGDDEKMLDFGRPALPGAGEEGVALAKGLLRRDAEPWAVKDMLRRGHQQQIAVLLVDRRMVGRDRDPRVRVNKEPSMSLGARP